MLNTAEHCRTHHCCSGHPARVQRLLRDFAKFPTERNACYCTGYCTGYITALYEFDVLTHNQHTVFLALSGVLQRDQVICALLINIIEV